MIRAGKRGLSGVFNREPWIEGTSDRQGAETGEEKVAGSGPPPLSVLLNGGCPHSIISYELEDQPDPQPELARVDDPEQVVALS
jgi:hypothetical protein